MADIEGSPEGYEVPVHRSLIEPRLTAGVPRTPAFYNGIVMAAICLGLQVIWYLPIGIFLHIGMAILTKYDPQWYDALMRQMKLETYYRP
ncbi:VirB3 family type IV secretion system protein (plasmid) [Dyella sp. BiH032]|uniref:VirB3 family type IV secretion system protein n=1 Tax=Dyella sp. BiH032 TaxID=3075430 RepID=UPI0028937CDD|nr:VirB3 family type IV secretion system protein [Dyella sp. BiH032]WNL48569.1 VirB3 family type IV secretion system protein [Dyella sp. BiH032]